MTNRNRNLQSKFRYGQEVRVVAGTKHPDFDLDIGGWTGSIEEIELDDDESWLYCIQWDRATLKKMGRKLIKRCDKENLDHSRTFLSEEELESA